MAIDVATPAPARPVRRGVRLLPGVVVAATGAGLGLLVNAWLPVASPLLVAILYGVVVANLGVLPAATAPGLSWSSRRLLRAGVVLLGLQLSLRQVAALGPGALVLVVAVVGLGVSGGVVLGRLLGLSPSQRILIACGFSICGAAAVAAADGAVGAEEEEVATAVALVVAFGTAMIAVVPALTRLLGLSSHAGGIWAGASIQEVAQVIAAGGMIGGGALATAVVVKLARVLLLAPVLLWIGWQRRTGAFAAGAATDPGSDPGPTAAPPLVPLFVVGFCVLVVVHTWLPLPALVLSLAKQAETGLLAAAMCALGCAVRWDTLRRVGPRPLVLGALLTLEVAAIGLVGAALL